MTDARSLALPADLAGRKSPLTEDERETVEQLRELVGDSVNSKAARALAIIDRLVREWR